MSRGRRNVEGGFTHVNSMRKKRSRAHPHPEHFNDLITYLKELGRLDKSLTRFSEHAKDKQTAGRLRENLRRYFDKEFERMRSFNEQFYEKIGSPNARRTGSPNAQDYKKGEARVRAFAKNFRKLQKLLAKARQRSKRFSDRSAKESSLTLTKKGRRTARQPSLMAAETPPVEVVHST
uniref:Uncharacterized protein n=1 Tax=Haemonchus contortus TaxID=6289 RepID=W6NGA6_HAECO